MSITVARNAAQKGDLLPADNDDDDEVTAAEGSDAKADGRKPPLSLRRQDPASAYATGREQKSRPVGDFAVDPQTELDFTR